MSRIGSVTLGLVSTVSLVALASCGDDGGEAAAGTTPAPAAVTDAVVSGAAATAPQLLAPDAAADLLAAPPEGLVVLDVRTPDEFAAGHLTAATLIDFQSPEFAADVAELDRDVPTFVYCRSGNRSAQAVAAMQALGFSRLYELDGGITAWEAAGLPVVTD